MKNILSYKDPCFTGQEILDWANYQINNETSHYKQGQRILRLFSKIKPDKKYFICSSYESWSVGYWIKQPIIYRYDKIKEAEKKWFWFRLGDRLFK